MCRARRLRTIAGRTRSDVRRDAPIRDGAGAHLNGARRLQFENVDARGLPSGLPIGTWGRGWSSGGPPVQWPATGDHRKISCTDATRHSSAPGFSPPFAPELKAEYSVSVISCVAAANLCVLRRAVPQSGAGNGDGKATTDNRAWTEAENDGAPHPVSTRARRNPARPAALAARSITTPRIPPRDIRGMKTT